MQSSGPFATFLPGARGGKRIDPAPSVDLSEAHESLSGTNDLQPQDHVAPPRINPVVLHKRRSAA